ncbi:hypothetical protein CEXT_445151 [Caerostris extrusa]|uniref:Uncharacterized protein n=1 Tax=Caerostris extrusa TaxID=172846 RepID=A0AAV4Y845_CAEEX|nr:hypothetical protein CEXT_445151 [Caerostris extrusa]
MRKAYDSKNCDLGIDAPLKCAKCPRFPKSNDNDVKNIKYNAPVVHKNLLRQFPLKTLIPGLSHLPPTNTYAKVITQTCRPVGGTAPLSESALALFKMLLAFIDDASIHFDLQLSKLLNMKAVILLKHYNYLIKQK